MRKNCFLSTLVLTVLVCSNVSAQDFSNKGKDFWVAYGYHTVMVGGNSQDMVLYFATDTMTTITITIPATGYTQTINVPNGNNITTSAPIPKLAGPGDARLLTEGTHDKGIHITSNRAMVAYAHIYNGNCSGATILYPTNTLGRECFSVNYKNWSNNNNANCWFYVVATDTGTTTVEITPQANIPGVVTTGGWMAGTTYTVNLTQGQVHNVMGILTSTGNPNTGVDLTGSKIKSINNGSGCKKIAVFSGSGRISISCDAQSSSSDNYMVQAMPKNAWGKKYLTAHANGNQANNIYRVCVSSPIAIVRINGAITPLPLINNFYYEIPATNLPQLIESDSAIMVAQYFTSQGECGNGTPGDPEVIYLSAVEQNINKVLWNATPNFAILNHSFNVVIPNGGTALSSFTLDGVPVGVGAFVPHPQDPAYSYLRMAVAQGFRWIQSDSGFNAIAYGFGNFESYGYNAGTNIKDLYQQIGVTTEWGIETTPSVCTNSPFKFKVSLPYCADSITWNLSNLPGPPVPSVITLLYSTCTPGAGGPDSTTIVNGKTIYWYSLPSFYTFTTVGVFPVTILTYSPNGECGTVQEIDFELTVSDPPIADFTWTINGCVTQPVQFTETTPQVPKATYRFWWDFGDPPSGPANNSTLRNPIHLFSGPGTYTVRYAAITTPGCLTDTVSHQITVDPAPTALFSVTPPFCPNVPITFTDLSTPSNSSSPLVLWTWDFGDGSPLVIRTTSTNEVHTYLLPGTYNATLQVETSTGCQSLVFTFPVIILQDGTITLSSAPGTDNQTVCINTPIINISYTVGGSSNGGSVTGLPAGVTGTYAGGVISIAGTPTVAGTFNYTVNTTGPCVNPSMTGTITVTPDGTVTLTSAPGTDNQTLCINTALIPITYAVGGSGTGGSVIGLPAGVTGTFAGGVISISGSPTVSGTFNYTVNTSGPCINPTANGTITVTSDGTVTLTSAPGTDNQSVCINAPIINITYSVGGSGNGGSVTGLPAGVNGTYAGGIITISGTPTVAGTFNYTVNTTGPCVNPSTTGTITVTPDGTITLTSAPGTDNQTLCINTPIVNITYVVGGSGTGGSVTGLPAGVTGTFAGGVITITGTPTIAGTFNYTVNTIGPCVNPTANGTITVTPDGTVTLTSAPGTDNQTVCINTPIINITYSVGGSGNGGSVSGLPPGVTGTFAGGVITISGSPTTTAGSPFTYTVNTIGPCVNPTATGTITVNPDATITLTSAPGTNAQELCINSPITNITYTVAGGGSGATVAGLPAGVTGSYAGGTFTISGTPTVSGTFNYTVTTTGICVQATATGSIIVNALPTANFNASTPSCETGLISFTDLSVPNSGTIVSWAWNFGDPLSGPLNTSTIQNPTHIYSASGSYTVTLIVTTDKGCISTTPAQQVSIYSKPLAGYILPEVCLSDTYAQFTDTSSVASPDNIVQWRWNFGDPISGPLNTSTLQNPQHSYTATGSYIVELIVRSNRGCEDTVTHTLFVNGSFPLAGFTVQNPATLCANDSVSIVEASTVFPGVITKVEIYWDNVNQPAVFDTDNFPITGKVYKHLYPNFQAPLTRIFAIRYRAYSGGVCVDDSIRNITVNAAPLVQFTPIPNICLDAAPYQITQAIEIGGVPGSGVFSGPGVSPTGLFNPAVAGSGTHTIKYVFTSSAAGCEDSLTQTIKVWIAPTADFTVSSPTCERQAVTFDGGTSASTEGTLTQWRWNFGDGTPVLIRTSGTPFTHIYNIYGTYTVTLNVITSNSCVSTPKTFIVDVKPLARPDFTFPAISCLPNANVSFTNNSTIPDGTQASFTYLWNFGDPGSGPVNTSTGMNPSHTYVGMGPYNVNLQVTSGAGCVHDTTIVLNSIHPQPIASFITDKVDVCIGGSISFTNTSNPLDGTLQSLSWDMADGNIRTTPSFTYTYVVPGQYDVSLYIINSFNCRSNTFTKMVSVNPYPPVNAGPSKFMLEGGQVQLTPAVNASYPITYLWTPGRYLSDSTIAMPIARPPDDTYFRLTVTSDKGCSAWDTMFVKVLKKPDIPNIFSPNGDGVHDKWVIKYLESYPGCTVELVNRYGQLVFRSVGYDKPWDGKINGTDAPVGTYYYVVSPKNGRTPITGYVDLIR